MAIRAAFNQGKYPTIAFVNLAKTPLGVNLDKLVAALDKQMKRDFVPIWGYPAGLYVTKKPKPDEWQVVFLDDADAAEGVIVQRQGSGELVAADVQGNDRRTAHTEHVHVQSETAAL